MVLCQSPALIVNSKRPILKSSPSHSPSIVTWFVSSQIHMVKCYTLAAQNLPVSSDSNVINMKELAMGCSKPIFLTILMRRNLKHTQRESNLWTAWFWTSALQNWEKINICYGSLRWWIHFIAFRWLCHCTSTCLWNNACIVNNNGRSIFQHSQLPSLLNICFTFFPPCLLVLLWLWSIQVWFLVSCFSPFFLNTALSIWVFLDDMLPCVLSTHHTEWAGIWPCLCPFVA